MRVVYRSYAMLRYEEGTISSVNESFAFVCYGLPGSTSQATRPEDLEPVTSDAALARDNREARKP
jgi:hypothetical protein